MTTILFDTGKLLDVELSALLASCQRVHPEATVGPLFRDLGRTLENAWNGRRSGEAASTVLYLPIESYTGSALRESIDWLAPAIDQLTNRSMTRAALLLHALCVEIADELVNRGESAALPLGRVH